MYGRKVHEAVLAAKETESGASIHVVDEGYDTGRVIAQCRVPVAPTDSAETLAARVQEREREALVVETLAALAAEKAGRSAANDARPTQDGTLERQFAAAVKLAERFPGIEVETSHSTPAIKVNGKFMARLRTEAEGWLAIRCDFVDREILLQAAPHVFHLTPHYQNYPMILVDLAAIDRGALLEVLERGWRMAASKKVIRDFDEQHHSAPRHGGTG